MDNIDAIFSDVFDEVAKKGAVERTRPAMENTPSHPFGSKGVVEHSTPIQTAQHRLKPPTIQSLNQEMNNALESSQVQVERDIQNPDGVRCHWSGRRFIQAGPPWA
jgi:hypothetical protein